MNAVYLDPVNTSVILYTHVAKAEGCKGSKDRYIVRIQSGLGTIYPGFSNEKEARLLMERVTELWKGIIVLKNPEGDEFSFNLSLVRGVAFEPDKSTIRVRTDQLTFRFEEQDKETIKRTEMILTKRPWQFLGLGPENFGG